MTQKVQAYQIAESIDLKLFRTRFEGRLVYGDAAELFYETGSGRFVYVFKYGAVSFLNYDDSGLTAFLQLIRPYCKNLFPESLTEEYLVDTAAAANRIGFNKIEITSAREEVLRLVMLNVTQSVALDYYEDQTSRLLESTNYYTQILVNRGRLGISGKSLRQYIGKTLLLKNRIAENLYVFDSPPETWEDEQLNRIDMDLKRTFDLQVRVRTIHEGLNIIKDNLELFQALMQHRNSNILEWIVIILILIEVLNRIIEKIL